MGMRADLYRITECPVGRLAIMPRPRAGDWLKGEVTSWRQQGLDVVVSLLQDVEVAELELGEESLNCENVGLRFVRFPIPDHSVPGSAQAVSELVSALAAELRQGKGIGIHCRMGIGRSSSMAVCVLIALGMQIEDAWKAVARARGLSVPDNPEQRVWVANWSAGRAATEIKNRHSPNKHHSSHPVENPEARTPKR